ncbi:MAG: SPOR domain-containing protein [Porticoccus sp.]|mgnify:FL=1|jgi:hypothetical protein|uniref:SPOR domain-containing protein n=1 Tax=Porticoccus sp. TaxID=2024853 RepID=UPI003299AE31
MRWLFFVLILINLVAGYWFYSAAVFHADQLDSVQTGLADQEDENYASLLLVGEVPATTEETSEQQPISDNNQASTAIDALPLDNARDPALCLLIGPLVDINPQELHQQLSPYRYGEELVWRTTTISEGYWLIIPPLGSQAEASKMLKDLRSKEIDSFLIAEGEYRTGITLGVFSDKSNMEHYRRELADQGYPVVIVPRVSTQEELWLQLRRYPDQQIPKDLADVLDQQGKNIGREVINEACVDLAPVE